MEDQISTVTPDAALTASSGTVNGANGNGQPNGEAGQGATGTESFIPQGIDVNTLPPQLRQQIEKINSDMVRGFTEKTTKLSDTVKSEVTKATESFKQKAELYDQIAQQEEFVKMWNEHVQKVNTQPGGQEQGNPELTQLKQQFEQINQKLQLQELSQVTDAFATAVNEKGEKIHPEFDKFNNLVMGQIPGEKGPEEFSFLRACVELSGGKTPDEKLANGYKKAQEFYNSIFEEGKKAGMGRLQEKARNGSLPPSHVNAGSTAPHRPKDALEALQFAKQGLSVNKG